MLYVPAYYRQSDATTIDKFVAEHSFATMISASRAGAVLASHAPFVTGRDERGRLRLQTHLARANGHVEELADGTDVLVTFQGPHAYISPRLRLARRSPACVCDCAVAPAQLVSEAAGQRADVELHGGALPRQSASAGRRRAGIDARSTVAKV